MIFGIPRSLFLKLAGSVVVAFALTMTLSWAILRVQSGRNAEKLMRRELADLRGEVEERINRRLVAVVMEVRDRFAEKGDRTVEALQRLAAEYRVDEICFTDTEGRVEASNIPHYIGFDFRTNGADAAAFLSLLDRDIEVVQPLRPNPTNGIGTKYVGVWCPEGGFVQIGCTLPSVRRLVQTTVSGVTHNQHLGGIGRVVVTTPEGIILSDASESHRDGSVFEFPTDDVYWLKDEIAGFPVYLLYPKTEVVRDRRVFLGVVALVTIVSLTCVALLVAVSVAGFVRVQVQKRLAAEMAMAASIQASSLPRVFPPYPALAKNLDIHAAMRPAKEVGGDFYDFYRVNADRFALVMADVSGKGVPAALFMMKAKTALKAALVRGDDLAAGLRAVNDELAADNGENLFVTAWVGVLDLRTGELQYVNAGHNPPFVKGTDGAVRALKMRSGPPLAAIAGVGYVLRETRLGRGETLLLYTDGLTEAMDQTGRLFGEARLQEAFATAPEAAEAICRTLVARVDDHAFGVAQADDMTLLACRFLARRVKF